MTEVTYSTQVFMPSIIGGMLLLSATALLYLYFKLKQSVYLATAVTLLNAFGFVIFGAAIDHCGATGDISLGMQFSRMEQLIGAAFIPITPWLIYSFGSALYPTAQRYVMWTSGLFYLVILVVAYSSPEHFVSVEKVTSTAGLKEANAARGAFGVAYMIRDGILALVFIYALWILNRLRKVHHVRAMAKAVMWGIVVSVAFSINDIVDTYTRHKAMFSPLLDFSYISVGLGLFALIVAYGAFQLFSQQLMESENKYHQARDLMRDVVDAIDSVIIGVDEELRVNLWNELTAAKTRIASNHAIGQPIDKIIPKLADEMDAIRRAVFDKTPSHNEKSLKLPSGETLYEDLKILPLESSQVHGAVLVVTDITAMKRLQETIVQTEKMVSIGGLAAGMAHEINNPLSGMMQNAQVLFNRLTMNSPANQAAAERVGLRLDALKQYMAERRIPGMLEAISDSGLQASRVIRNMLDFSREETGSIEHVNVSELLNNAIELAQNDWDLVESYDFKNIQFVKQYDFEMPTVPCEIQHMSQVFFNLIKNAAQSMYEATSDKPSVITIRTFLKDSRRACIEIEDNGPGIPREIRNRIFDPFFTTQGVGRGSGLGLSASYFIVTERHQGNIDVICPDSGGTRFVIELPVSQAFVNENVIQSPD